MVEQVLNDWVAESSKVLGDSLRAVVLYGSAAEGKLRPSSDVNVLMVLAAFDAAKIAQLRGRLQQYEAAVRLSVMFLLEEEIPAAMEAFAAKFADILRRRRILFGDDPFTGRSISRAAEIARLKQVLLNLVLRLRAAYAYRSRDEALVATVADAAGPLRSCAALLLELEGRPAASGKEALADIVLAEDQPALARMSEAREAQQLPADVASATILRLIEIAQSMHTRAQALS